MALTQTSTNGIKDATIATADIADDAVTADKLANAINTDIAAKAVLTGSTNNTITTVTGANAIQGEANLTCDGDYLFIGGATASDAINGAQNFIIKDTSSDGGMSVLSGTSGLGQIHFSDTDANGQGRVVYSHNGDSLRLHTAGSERMRVDSSGNVGIGINNPTFPLDLRKDATSVKVHIGASDGSLGTMPNSSEYGLAIAGGNLEFGLFKDGSGNYQAVLGTYQGSTAIPLVFRTASRVERMRIDENGTVMIGGSTQFSSNGGLNVEQTSNGAEVVSLSLSNQGTADNSAVIISHRGRDDGSNQADYNYIKMVADDTGNGSEDGSIRLWTCNGGSMGEKVRVQSAGGISFNGDAAAANALDDYEEGDHNPTDQSTASLTFTYTNTGRYTKIGRLVTCHFDITYPTTSDSNVTKVSLPFANATSFCGGVANWTNLGRPCFVHVSGGYAYINDNDASHHLLNSEASGKRFMCNFWYYSAT